MQTLIKNKKKIEKTQEIFFLVFEEKIIVSTQRLTEIIKRPIKFLYLKKESRIFQLIIAEMCYAVGNVVVHKLAPNLISKIGNVYEGKFNIWHHSQRGLFGKIGVKLFNLVAVPARLLRYGVFRLTN